MRSDRNRGRSYPFKLVRFRLLFHILFAALITDQGPVILQTQQASGVDPLQGPSRRSRAHTIPTLFEALFFVSHESMMSLPQAATHSKHSVEEAGCQLLRSRGLIHSYYMPRVYTAPRSRPTIRYLSSVLSFRIVPPSSSMASRPTIKDNHPRTTSLTTPLSLSTLHPDGLSTRLRS